MMITPDVYIFSDASFDPRSKLGVTGYLVVEKARFFDSPDSQKSAIELRLYQDTNCTRLEFEAVLLVLEEVKKRAYVHVEIFTDSKSVVELPTRRARLESSDFISKSSGKELANADLYRRYFKLIDEVQPRLTWIKGHKARIEKEHRDHLFSLVDRATRQTLRESLA